MEFVFLKFGIDFPATKISLNDFVYPLINTIFEIRKTGDNPAGDYLFLWIPSFISSGKINRECSGQSREKIMNAKMFFDVENISKILFEKSRFRVRVSAGMWCGWTNGTTDVMVEAHLLERFLSGRFAYCLSSRCACLFQCPILKSDTLAVFTIKSGHSISFFVWMWVISSSKTIFTK